MIYVDIARWETKFSLLLDFLHIITKDIASTDGYLKSVNIFFKFTTIFNYNEQLTDEFKLFSIS